MTNITMSIGVGNNLFYDAEYHAGEHDACTIISTVSSMLIAEAERCGIKPAVLEKGHCRIGIPDASPEAVEVWKCAEEVLTDLSHQMPQYVRMW